LVNGNVARQRRVCVDPPTVPVICVSGESADENPVTNDRVESI
jgi:hypothetical protein